MLRRLLRPSILKAPPPLRAMISDSSASSTRTTTTTTDDDGSQPPVPSKALPAPDAAAAGIALDVSGQGTTVKLDALGPMVVNVDGTISRIANWHNMSDLEQQNTLRIIGKRNQARLAALRDQQPPTQS